MKTKKCSRCKLVLSVDKFYKIKQKSGIYPSAKCIKCQKEYNAEYKLKHKEQLKIYDKEYKSKTREQQTKNLQKWINNQKDGYHYVYHIADGNYVGVTDCVYMRKKYHLNVNKRNLEKGTGFQIIYKTPCRKEALKVESSLHALGFNG